MGDSSSVRLVEMLAWLPAKLGFPVPDARAVIEGRLNGNIADARAWSGLLVGSIACYGILPRLLAWAVCKILLKTSENSWIWKKPYYQAVIRRWQNKITDADTRRGNRVRRFAENRLERCAEMGGHAGDPNGRTANGSRAGWRRNGWIRALPPIRNRLPR